MSADLEDDSFDGDILEVALRMPTLREQIAVILDMTAAVGTPEIIYRIRNEGETMRQMADRLRDNVLHEADRIIALLDARRAKPTSSDVCRSPICDYLDHGWTPPATDPAVRDVMAQALCASGASLIGHGEFDHLGHVLRQRYYALADAALAALGAVEGAREHALRATIAAEIREHADYVAQESPGYAIRFNAGLSTAARIAENGLMRDEPGAPDAH